jgi:hypothetical protein
MARTKSTKEQKKLADDARLLRAWRKFHREEREAVLAGPYSVTLGELFRMFANLKHVQPAQLIGFIGAIDWAAIDYQTRLTVLHEVNAAITARRNRQGLNPIDDPLPGAPPNAFQVIRGIVTKFPASRGDPPEQSGKQWNDENTKVSPPLREKANPEGVSGSTVRGLCHE